MSADLPNDDNENPMGRWTARLFIVRGATNSRLAETNLRAFLAAHPELPARVEIVDVRERPEEALTAGVFVTPTLIRMPTSRGMIAVGNLQDGRVLLELLS